MVDVCDVPVVSTVCDKAGDAAASLVTAPFDWLAEGMGNAAEWMFKSVWNVFDSTTSVDITSDEYMKVYNILFGVAVFVMLGFFLLQVIGGMVRREPAALTRALTGLAKSILGSFVAITLLAVGIGGLSLKAPGTAAILTIFLAGLAIGAAVIVWISLLVRKALLLVAIVFAPVALAGASWDQTRGWIGKWATFVIALILSKLVLVVIFLLATAQVSAPIDADLQSVSEPIAGVVLMLMAGFAPYMTYKAISFMGFDMYHAMSAEQETKSSMNRPLPIRTGGGSGGMVPKILGGDGGGSGSAGRGAAPAVAPNGGAAISGAGGASSGGAAAGGVMAAGAMAAKEAATAGPKMGNYVAAQSSGQAEQASAPAGAAGTVPAHTADPTPAMTGPRSDGSGAGR
jgi:type IV secretion system protein TrbL